MSDQPQPEREPIPPPQHVGAARVIGCPQCARTWPRTQRAAYELHWRLTHGVRRAL